jgi:hypothetical protein
MQKTEVLAEQAIFVGFSVIMEMQTGTDEDIQQHQTEKGDENTLLSYGVHQTKVYPRLIRLSNANGCQKDSEWSSDGMKLNRVFIRSDSFAAFRFCPFLNSSGRYRTGCLCQNAATVLRKNRSEDKCSIITAALATLPPGVNPSVFRKKVGINFADFWV